MIPASLKRTLSRWFHGPRVVRAPLLDSSALLAFRRLAELATRSPFAPERESRQAQLGERISSIRGSGMDFDDSRPFMAGDDRRHINWRLFARTGELYLKMFREERRPQLYLLLDRRDRMRMGSRSRLKLEQALNIAASLALMAGREQMAVGALALQPENHWLKSRAGEAGIIELIHALNEPAPPLDGAEEPSLREALGQLQGLLRPGCIVCLLSDFSDLDDTTMPLLWQLVREHDVMAFHIIDEMERQLPPSGTLRLATTDGGSPLEIDCGDEAVRRAYAEQAEEGMERIATSLKQAGVNYQVVDSDDDFISRWLGVGDGAG